MLAPQQYETSRRDARYSLQLPVRIWLRSQKSTEIKAESDNISLRGISFSSDSAIPLGSEVNIEISLAAVTGQKDARLASMGRILRVTRETAGGFKIAVGCEQPFEFIESGKRKLQ